MAKPRYTYRDNKETSESATRRKMSSGAYDRMFKDNIPTMKIKEGESTIRILPRTWDDRELWPGWWEIQVYLHRNVGADNGTYLCLDKMKNEPCPICEARRDAADQEERDALRPGARAYCWVIDRDNEKAGPQVMGMPASLFNDINNRAEDKKTHAILKISHPEKGYDLVFTREGADLRTKYTGVEIMRDSTPLHDDPEIAEKWLNYVETYPLPDQLVFYEPDYLEKVMTGQSERKAARDEDEDEDERKPRKAARRAADEDEEEDDRRLARGKKAAKPWDDDEDEDEDEDERSSRKRVPLKAKKNGEDEDEDDGNGDDDREDEDEKEKPLRTRGKSRRDEDEDEDEDEKPTARTQRTKRRDEDEDEDEDEPRRSPSRQARRSVEWLKSRTQR